MNTRSTNSMLLALLVSSLMVGVARADSDEEAQDIHEYINGQRILITFREGGAVYGTYVSVNVQFCESGRYFTYRESKKQTVMDNEQVSTWRDQGTWEVTTVQGNVGIRYLSVSGERHFVPVRLVPSGRLWIGPGVSVIRQGRTACN